MGVYAFHFQLKDLGINKQFIKADHITMESEKYICIREKMCVVIIDMTKPEKPLRLPITADSAIMSPHTAILAFKVEGFIY
jgi:clathrin heavy chain